MKIKASNTDDINIVDKIYYISKVVLILGLPLVIISSFILFNHRFSVFADTSGVDNFTLTLPSSCTIQSINNTHTATLENNTRNTNLGGNPTTFTVYCNDKDGYIIYTIGSSNGTEGNTDLIGSTGSNIPTGIYSSEDTTSSCSFRITALDNTLTTNPTYAVGEPNFATIPSAWDWVAKKESGTVDSTTGSQITATYSAYISGTQAAGTYTGQVKYVMFHPSSAVQPTTLAEAYKNAGKSKVPVVDPSTGDTNYYYTMQDMNSSICNAANVFGAASDLEVVDIRDNSIYWITKLQNNKIDSSVGQCWMTENLDLDLSTATALTSNDTNLSTDESVYTDAKTIYSTSTGGYTYDSTTQVATWTPLRDTIAPSSLSSSTWSNNNSSPYSYDRGNAEPDGYKDGHGKSGNYYNWTAAVASNASGNITGGNATNSICPKGWRLPDTRTYEFSKMLYAYDVTKDATNGAGFATGGYNKLVSSPLWFVRSGSVSNGSLNNSANFGSYWSSAVGSGSIAFVLDFYSGNVYPARNGYRNLGLSVRCVAE